jgi:O-antigen/teichoic acid export membrane protein
LLRYIRQVSIAGIGAIAGVIAMLVAFADPIMQFVYGYSAADQVSLILAFGAYSALAHVGFVVTAGLRALDDARATFLPQVALSAASLAVALAAVSALGVAGTLFAVLVPRLLFTIHLALVLRRKAQSSHTNPALAAP